MCWRALLLCLFLVTTLSAAHGAPVDHRSTGLQLPKRRPNIVVFLVDDMGWQDTSVPFYSERTPFNDRYYTPNMQTLAAAGMKFTNAYAACVCSPTRVSIMTGQNPARHGVTNWTLFKDKDQSGKHPTLLPPPDWNVNSLQPDDITLPRLLKSAGYRTIHVGKAHWGAKGTPGEDPRALGFDVNIAGHAAGGPGSYLGTQNFSAAWRGGGHIWDVPGLEKYYGRDIFLTEALTIEANAQLDRAVADGVPFYLYMSHYAVHAPITGDHRYLQKYLDAGLDKIEARYASMIEGMDASLGEIMANLKRHHIADNTIIIFLSDNGGLSAHGRGGQKHTHNKPLKSGKGSSYEGGVRVPMIVVWPGVVEPGSVSNVPVICEDVFPTVLSIAGVEIPSDYQGKVDGRDITPILKMTGGFDADRPLYWHYPHVWGVAGPGIAPYSAIRQGDWKLIYFYADRRYELYDLSKDIGEHHNLVARRKDVVKRLAGRLKTYLKRVHAPMPVWKDSGKRAELAAP